MESESNGKMGSRLREDSVNLIDKEVRELIAEFGGKVCCLACCFKLKGLDAVLVEFLLREGISVHTFWAGNDNRTAALGRQFSMENYRLGAVCIRALLESNDPESTLVVHRRYYEHEVLQVSYSAPTFRYQIGNVRRGQVIEIFYRGQDSIIWNNITSKLVRDFCTKTAPTSAYPNLPNVETDEFGKVSTKSGIISVGRSAGGMINYKSCESKNWDTATPEEKKIIVSDFMKKFTRLSLVVVRVADYDGTGISAIEPWLELFSAIGRGLDDVILVFAVDYNAFPKINVHTKSGARNMYNGSIPLEHKHRVIWMDTTVDNICDQDDRDHINLSLKPLVG